MKYIGIDLAWSQKNDSGVALLEDDTLIDSDVVTGLDSVIEYTNTNKVSIPIQFL